MTGWEIVGATLTIGPLLALIVGLSYAVVMTILEDEE